MKFKTAFDDEIQAEIEELSKMQVGSDVYKVTVDEVTKLMDRRIELQKLENERIEKIESRNAELELKYAQMEEDKKDRRVKNGLTAAGILLPLGVTIWGTLKSFKFEETGSVSTIMGRGFIQKLLPKFK